MSAFFHTPRSGCWPVAPLKVRKHGTAVRCSSTHPRLQVVHRDRSALSQQFPPKTCPRQGTSGYIVGMQTVFESRREYSPYMRSEPCNYAWQLWGVHHEMQAY